MSNKNKKTRKTVRKGNAKGKGFVMSELSRMNKTSNAKTSSYTEDDLFFDLTDCEFVVKSYFD